MAGTILIGTSSWTDPTLVKDGNFYPPATQDRRGAAAVLRVAVPAGRGRLHLLLPADREELGAVDRAHAAGVHVQHQGVLAADEPPDEARLALQGICRSSRRTIDKRNIYRDKLPDEVVDEVWQRFRDALMPLHSAGKLGAVLFQFPQWFVISRKSKAYIEECEARLPDYRVAVEFRHKSWMRSATSRRRSFLEEHDLPYVCVDMPQGFDSSVPPIAAATAKDLAMVRFHGREHDAWNVKGETAAERFKYDYPREELAEWAPRVEALAAERARPTCS